MLLLLNKDKMIDIKKLDDKSDEQLGRMMHYCGTGMNITSREIVFPSSHMDFHRAELFKGEINENTHHVLVDIYGFKWTGVEFTGLTGEDYQVVKDRVTYYALKSIKK